MKLALVGATGLVGTKMLEVLEERNFPVDGLVPVASQKSVGKKLTYKGKEYTIVSLEDAVKSRADVALFSAGGAISKQWAPIFAQNGTKVIDNSSAWRMVPGHKLIVPEVNGTDLEEKDFIIANPNCSTIQMVLVLAPLHKKYGIKRVVVSTYQSITGTGQQAVAQMEAERQGKVATRVYPHIIDKNCLPHCDIFVEDGYTKEELKLVNESRKILNTPELKVTATAVRVPVVGGHSESINVEFEHDFDLKELKGILSAASGVIVQDTPQDNQYPMPIHAEGKDEVFVGRIRRDFSQDNTLNMWVVSDNLRKGAATNTVQIAEYLHEKKWI